MSTRELPDRPNLEHLKKQAKSLLRAAQARDAASLQRFRLLPAFSDTRAEALDAEDLALHDAQSVIAREHGFPSWTALREEVEARTMSFEAAIEDFIRCATGGATGRARRLLAHHPRIATANLWTALVLADVDQVAARVDADRSLATQAGGPHLWEPLLYACHTCMQDERPGGSDRLVAIVRQLLQLGANPNGEYHWNWHPELPRTVLWAAVCTIRHLPLAEVLLEAGANPTDGVTAHIAGGGGNLDALELLHRYGLNVNGVPGGVPPLVHILLWADNAAGPRWLVEHGADVNLAWGEAGEAPLHVAARRWDVPMVDLLVGHGANLSMRRADGATPHTLAALHGNREVASWLAAHGAVDELSPLDRFVAACASGDRAAADAMLAARPSLRSELQRDQHLLLQRAADFGEAGVLETMLGCGFDPRIADNDRVTPLHRAAMSGHVDAVRVLLAHGAPVDALDGMFSAPPLVWAVEGREHTRPGTDHVGVARLLIAAGSPLEWTAPDGAPSPERTQEGLVELKRDAAARASV
jgi:ankyrin repeat protein